MSDLIQEGHVGLLERRDASSRSARCGSRRMRPRWIRASIQDYILRNGPSCAAEVFGAKALFFNLRRLRARLSKTTAR
jgi:DNA-directed RNA polymerase sigma subunit (sigma70/sigma32)